MGPVGLTTANISVEPIYTTMWWVVCKSRVICGGHHFSLLKHCCT